MKIIRKRQKSNCAVAKRRMAAMKVLANGSVDRIPCAIINMSQNSLSEGVKILQ
jgi:hypothetical protein